MKNLLKTIQLVQVLAQTGQPIIHTFYYNDLVLNIIFFAIENDN